MQELLTGLNPPDGSAFVYNILVYSMEEHLTHLRLVLDRLHLAGLKLKTIQVLFVCREVEFLVYCITPEGLKTTPCLVAAVQDFQWPSNARQTRQFLGLCSFYWRFIPSFAKMARPLHQLTRVGACFSWTEECESAFTTLKRKLC